MEHLNPEYEYSAQAHESEDSHFADKIRDLLPGVDFEESAEMFDARKAILEALQKSDQNPDFLQSVWTEYAIVCEQIVDSRTETDSHTRAQLQIAMLVHKALIFYEIGNILRYGEDLSDAEEYAYNMYFDSIAEAIGAELDNLLG